MVELKLTYWWVTTGTGSEPPLCKNVFRSTVLPSKIIYSHRSK
jgi:hypothetical protein